MVLAGVLVAALILATTRRANDPVYDGRHLSEWLVLLITSNKPGSEQIGSNDPATRAIISIGTNGLPYLLQAIVFDESSFRSKAAVQQLMMKIPFLDDIGLLRNWAYNVDKAKRAHGAMRAFEILGPRAAPAIPELARLAASHTNFTAHAAVSALGDIGPEGQPVLVALITNRPFAARALAISCLAPGEHATASVALLVDCLNDPDTSVVRATARALGRIKSRPELVVPALVDRLQTIQPMKTGAGLTDDQRALQREIVLALGEFGQPAHIAAPWLFEALQEETGDENVACWIIKTLGRISKEPEPVVPVLMTYLDHTNNWLVHCSVVALAELGPLARQALPALTNALYRHDGNEWIEYAIQQITTTMRTNAPPQ